MIAQEEIREVLGEYDLKEVTVGVLGSHSALDICRGAKDLGFRTLVVCQKGKEKTYDLYYRTDRAGSSTGIVDQTIILENLIILDSEYNTIHLFGLQFQSL